MLSNLLVKSNVVHKDEYQDKLANLSAMDLRSVHERHRLLPISFDPGHGTLTPRQKEEWLASYFFGDEKVSLSEDNRLTSWIKELRAEYIKKGSLREKDLNEEVAFEWLWLLEKSKELGDSSQKGLEMAEKLRAFLKRQRYGEPDIQTRLASFYPHPLKG